MKKDSGFTLIELTIVIAIIGIIAAVALPAYQNYTLKSKYSEDVAVRLAEKNVEARYFENVQIVQALKSDSISLERKPAFETDYSVLAPEWKDMRSDGRLIIGSSLEGDALEYDVVRSYYATDRNLTGEPNPSEMFGSERSDELTYGWTEVSIPRKVHAKGELESPKWWRLEFKEKPEKHVVLLKATLLTNDFFFASLSKRIRNSKSKSSLLFVHGYNVTFEDAARRTAQMAYDLAFDGGAVFYSWPSKGSKAAYFTDSDNIAWAQKNIEGFLRDYLTRTDSENIYLIAHSMGNRGLTKALNTVLRENPELQSKIDEIILAAPDIDADVFKRDIAPALVQAGQSITMYASSKDVALSLSRGVNGNNRAGDTDRGILIVDGLDTVDASKVDAGILGHSYFADSPEILGDLHQIINNSLEPESRFSLRPVDAENGRYWEFQR